MHIDELKATLYNDDTMEAHFTRIREEVARDKAEVCFHYLRDRVNNSDPDYLTDAQAEHLRTKGYKVEYNQYHDREWAISGWA